MNIETHPMAVSSAGESNRAGLPPVVCIVGASGSGKTTLIEALIPRLRERGFRVGTLKHTHHTVTFDREGKDSWRHAHAGAEQVVLLTPNGFAYMNYQHEDATPEEVISRCFQGADVVLVEGYKWGKLPKIEVFRREHTPEPLCLDDPLLLALVTNDEVETNRRRFRFADVESLTAFLSAHIAVPRRASRPCGTVKSCLGPRGTMRVGLMSEWVM